jgi:hypothetical protein
MREHSWFDAITDPVPLRTATPFEAFSVRCEQQPRLLLMANARLDPSEARARADAIASAHERLEGPHIPGLQARGEHQGRPWLLLRAAAIADGDDVIRTQVDRNARQPYRAAIGGLDAIGAALRRMHGTRSPQTGQPYAIGAIGLANLYYEPDGTLWLLGAGDNGFARASTLLPTVIAPEVALGEPPTPASDVFALSALMRAMVPYVELPAAISRVLRGHDANTPLGKLTHETNARVWGLPHALRPSLATLDRVVRGVVALLGESVSYGAHREFVAALLAHDEPEHAAHERAVLELADDGSWFRLDAQETQRIASRAALRRVLLCIVEHADRGESCDVRKLLEAGWPGERVDPEAGANRVYVAVSALRRMGLRTAIERFDLGYRLVPGVRVERRRAELGPSRR